MQKILIILFFMVLCYQTKAQEIFVNGKSLNMLNVNYITVKAQKTWMATRLSAFLDYGQGSSDSQQEMTDANKKSMFFKSRVELFNLLDKNGWDLVDTYEETKEGKVFVLHIFRRKK